MKLEHFIGYFLFGSMLGNLMIMIYVMIYNLLCVEYLGKWISPEDIYGSLIIFFFIWGISGLGTGYTIGRLYRENYE